MSKEKPEVGDVWEVDGKIYYVYALCYRADFQMAYAKTICRESIDKGCAFFEFAVLLRGKYLGKSKVSIKELFDVRD